MSSEFALDMTPLVGVLVEELDEEAFSLGRRWE